MMDSMKKLLFILASLLLLTPITACSRTLSSKTIEGQVVEQKTHTPVPDAIVVVLWNGRVGTIGHGSGVCYHVETTTTDAQGRFRIPPWKKPSPFGDIAHPQVERYAYKPGYTFEHQDKGALYLKPFTGTRGERVEYLMGVVDATRCGTKDESERNLHRLYQALYEEGNRIAVTKSEKEIVDTLRYWSTFVLFDPSKPSTRDEKGRLINIEPREKKN